MANASVWDGYSYFYNIIIRVLNRQRENVFQQLSLNKEAENNQLNIWIPGCGSGLDFPFIPNNSVVYASDFSKKMLQKSKRFYQQLENSGHHFQLNLAFATAENSELTVQSIDWVFLHLILAVTDKPKELLAEAIRVLKPGAKISLWDKAVPQGSEISIFRAVGDKITTALGTSLTLDIDALLVEFPLEIMSRTSYSLGQVQHLVLRKKYNT